MNDLTQDNNRKKTKMLMKMLFLFYFQLLRFYFTTNMNLHCF